MDAALVLVPLAYTVTVVLACRRRWAHRCAECAWRHRATHRAGRHRATRVRRPTTLTATTRPPTTTRPALPSGARVDPDATSPHLPSRPPPAPSHRPGAALTGTHAAPSPGRGADSIA